MSTYLLPNGQPWDAVDGSSLARRLLASGATILYDDAQIAAARAAWNAGLPIDYTGADADFVTKKQLEQLLGDLTPGGGGNAQPDPDDPNVLLVTTGGGWAFDPNEPVVIIAA